MQTIVRGAASRRRDRRTPAQPGAPAGCAPGGLLSAVAPAGLASASARVDSALSAPAGSSVAAGSGRRAAVALISSPANLRCSASSRSRKSNVEDTTASGSGRADPPAAGAGTAACRRTADGQLPRGGVHGLDDLLDRVEGHLLALADGAEHLLLHVLGHGGGHGYLLGKGLMLLTIPSMLRMSSNLLDIHSTALPRLPAAPGARGRQRTHPHGTGRLRGLRPARGAARQRLPRQAWRVGRRAWRADFND